MNVEILKATFMPGMRVQLISMEDVQAPLPGSYGTITHVDDIKTIFVAWDNGSSLGLIYGIDEFKMI